MRTLIVGILSFLILFLSLRKGEYRASMPDGESMIRTLEREKAEAVYEHSARRLEILESLHGRDNRETREAELASILALKDVEIARIREGLR